MRSTRDRYEPGDTLLSRRLDQLRETFSTITVRLRATIANAVGQTLGTVVRDTVLHVLNSLQEPLHSNTLSSRENWRDPHLEDEESPAHQDDALWDVDRDDEARWEPQPRGPETPTAKSERLSVAVCAALEATAGAQRVLGKQTLWRLLGVGLLTGTISYLAPTVALAGLGLLRSANHLRLVRNTLSQFQKI